MLRIIYSDYIMYVIPSVYSLVVSHIQQPFFVPCSIWFPSCLTLFPLLPSPPPEKKQAVSVCCCNGNAYSGSTLGEERNLGAVLLKFRGFSLSIKYTSVGAILPPGSFSETYPALRKCHQYSSLCLNIRNILFQMRTFWTTRT